MSNSMGLTIPVVSSTPGPDYANQINNDELLIAEHDHTTGKGVQVPSAGLNINADLPFGSNDATELRSARFTDQSAPLAAGTDVDCLSGVEGDLYWNNGDGFAVKITNGTGLNASAIGGFTGLSGTTGAATYASGPGSFEFTSSPGVPATVKVGPLVSENAAGRQITISPPAGTGNYGLTLPTALPASTKFLRVTSTGVITDDTDTDNSTIEVSSSIIRVKDSGIVTAKIADANVTTTKIADANVTRPKLVAVGQQISTGSGISGSASTSYAAVPNCAVTLTTTGRPVMLLLVNDVGSVGFISGSNTNGANFKLDVTGSATTTIGECQIGGISGGQVIVPPGGFSAFYVPAAGTYTFTLKAKAGTSGRWDVANICLVAYEL